MAIFQTCIIGDMMPAVAHPLEQSVGRDAQALITRETVQRLEVTPLQPSIRLVPALLASQRL